MLYNLNRIIGDTVTVSATTTSAAMATAFGAGVQGFRINANTNIHFAIAQTPVATTNGSPLLPHGETGFFNVQSGQKVAVVAALTGGLVSSANGTAYITPVE